MSLEELQQQARDEAEFNRRSESTSVEVDLPEAPTVGTYRFDPSDLIAALLAAHATGRG